MILHVYIFTEVSIKLVHPLPECGAFLTNTNNAVTSDIQTSNKNLLVFLDGPVGGFSLPLGLWCVIDVLVFGRSDGGG